MTTANNDNPVEVGKVPLLALDLWEHAYYLTHHNHRVNYVKSFFRVIDWERVARRYADATGQDPDAVAPNEKEL